MGQVFFKAAQPVLLDPNPWPIYGKKRGTTKTKRNDYGMGSPADVGFGASGEGEGDDETIGRGQILEMKLARPATDLARA